MTQQTKIEWTDFTVNFWEGCQKVGPGCDNCYAEERNGRFSAGANWGPGAPRRLVKGGPDKLRKIERDALSFHREHGRWPRVFLSSLCDVFDNAASPAWRIDLFRAIEAAPNCRFQMLTKRVGNVFQMIPPAWANGGWPSHVGLMITVVNQEEANRDIPKLLDLKARLDIPWVGLSIEPMLAPIDLMVTSSKGHDIQSLRGVAVDPTDPDGADEYYRTAKIDWVICGGESGPKARPMHPDWARSLRDQCWEAETPFLFKQWGEWIPGEFDVPPEIRWQAFPVDPTDSNLLPEMDGNPRWNNGLEFLPTDTHCLFQKVGKKAAGRILDGSEHNGFPEALT